MYAFIFGEVAFSLSLVFIAKTHSMKKLQLIALSSHFLYGETTETFLASV